MRKITYTTKLHVYRLELMLNRPDICKRCPAVAANMVVGHGMFEHYMKDHYKNCPCDICRTFVKLTSLVDCPCNSLADPITDSLKAIAQYKAKHG